MKKASIIILGHKNYLPHLRSCLNSLKNQTIDQVNFEFILVLNGDLGDQFDEQMALNILPLKIIKTSQISRGAARNLGAQHAHGDILAFIDMHVTVPTNWAEVSFFEFESKQVDVVQAGIDFSELNNYMSKRFKKVHLIRTLKSLNYLYEYNFQKFPSLDTSAIMIKRNAFQDVGGFDEHYARFEDRNLGMRLINRGYLIHGTTKIVVLKNLQRKSNLRQILDLLSDVFYSIKCSFENTGKIDFSRKYILSSYTYAGVYFMKEKKFSNDFHFTPNFMGEIILNFLITAAYGLASFYFIFKKKTKIKKENSVFLYDDTHYKFTAPYYYWSCDDFFYLKCAEKSLKIPFALSNVFFNTEKIQMTEKNPILDKILTILLKDNILKRS